MAKKIVVKFGIDNRVVAEYEMQQDGSWKSSDGKTYTRMNVLISHIDRTYPAAHGYSKEFKTR